MHRRTFHRWSAWAVATGVAGVSGACAEPKAKPVDFSETRRVYRSKDYPAVLRAWTRHGKVVRDVGTVIETWCTFKSADFRQAHTQHWAEVYGLSDKEREDLLASELDTARTLYEFHMTSQSTTARWNDFEKSSSPWKVTLVDGNGVELSPESITVQKLPDLYVDQFFPFRTPFSRTFLVRFRTPEGEAFSGARSGRIVLRLVSPFARVDLRWESAR